MFKIRNVLVAVICLLFVSCAPRITIMLDGAPIPDHAYVLTNPATNIEVEVVIARWYYVPEGDEKILWPQYLSLDMGQWY